ncbi:VWA domain-containing protein [Roseomonas sp. GCM10028921]
MNDQSDMPSVTLDLSAGLDRTLAWEEGGSVRYLVADLRAQGGPTSRRETPALNLALAIDVSGSMGGDKIKAARRAALAVAAALAARDRLSLVAFNNTAEVLLEPLPMDSEGRATAAAAIKRLRAGGGTNLFEGWLQAVERVALAQAGHPQASHRVVLLSDGQANDGVTDRAELARHTGELLARGIITSTVGIGDGYDEELLGGMAEAGGGRLHDAEHAPEIGEVVLGELREGRTALIERATLRLTVPANLRAEVVGPWAHTVLPGAIEVLVGTLLPGQTKRVVMRLHCPSGAPGTAMLLGVSAGGAAAETAAMVEVQSAEIELQLARGSDNKAQPRDLDRSLAVVRAWQAEVLRKAVRMNREGDRRAAGHFLRRELDRMQHYARGVPGTEALLAELVLVQRRAGEVWDERTRKGVFAAASMAARSELDLRDAAPPSIAERFGGKGR